MNHRTTGTRPAHHRPALIALVAAGGAIGTTARYLVSVAVPVPQTFPADGFPTATLVVNLIGSFVLGWLLDALAARGPETPRRRALRLSIGTGVLGGFTTFSSLALETDRLLADNRIATAAAYSLGSLILGMLCVFAGMAVAGRWTGRRHPRSPVGVPGESTSPAGGTAGESFTTGDPAGGPCGGDDA